MLSFSGAAKNQSDAFKAPDLMLIPAGWFWMGSESGQDNERPRHRVWIDEFRLAACQVTNREYGFFLQAKGHHHPPLWHDPNFPCQISLLSLCLGSTRLNIAAG